MTPNENMENVLNWFEDTDTVNYISGILAYDFEITDVEKGIEDIEKAYKKHNLITRRNEIINKLNDNTISKEEVYKFRKRIKRYNN